MPPHIHLSPQLFQSPGILSTTLTCQNPTYSLQSSQLPHPSSIMDAFTQQMLMINLNSQANQAISQPMMQSSLSYSTNAATSMAWVPPVSYSSHHSGTVFTQHGHPMHPVLQLYGPYSPQNIPPQGQVHASHHHLYHSSQPHNGCEHHPEAIAWDGASRAIHSSTPQCVHGKDGGREISRRPHASTPPGRKSCRDVPNDTWSTTAQKAHSGSKNGAHRNSRRKVANNTWSTTAQKR